MNLKKTGLLICVLLASLLLLAESCSGPAPSSVAPQPTAPSPGIAPAPAPAPAASPSPAPVTKPTAAPAKTFNFRYTAQFSPSSYTAPVNRKWAELIEKQSGGRIKMQLYFAESLAKQTDVYRAIQTGIADIAYYTSSTDPGLIPLNQVMSLPFIFSSLKNRKDATAITFDLIKKFPQMEKEFQGMKITGISVMPPDQFHFTKKQARVPADVKGMKLIARGMWPEVMKAVGVAPLNLGVADWYTSLDRGLAEGHIVHFLVLDAFKTIELLKSHTIFGAGGSSATVTFYLMNIDSWNSLPPDLQKVMNDAGKFQEEEHFKAEEALMQKVIADANTRKHTFLDLKPEEIQQWVDAAKPQNDKWIADYEAKGLPAKAIFTEITNLVKQYNEKSK